MARQDRANAPRGAAPQRRGGSPLLTGMVIGILVGLAVALGVALYFNEGPSPFSERRAAEPPRSAPPPTAADKPVAVEPAPVPAPRDDKDTLQFHEILRGPRDGREGGREVKPAPVPAPSVEEVIYLQVASLSSAADADTLKVQLTLSGFEPRVQSVQLDDGKVVHRVRLGPFASVKDAEIALVDVKRKNQIEGRVIKEKQPAAMPGGQP